MLENIFKKKSFFLKKIISLKIFYDEKHLFRNKWSKNIKILLNDKQNIGNFSSFYLYIYIHIKHSYRHFRHIQSIKSHVFCFMPNGIKEFGRQITLSKARKNHLHAKKSKTEKQINIFR
jgi:hypothetical protein